MTTLDMWSAVLGFVLPLAVAFINQSHWTKPLRGIVAFLISLFAAFIEVWLRGEVTLTNWVRSALVVFLAAIATYNLWWKPSLIAPKIEAATSVR